MARMFVLSCLSLVLVASAAASERCDFAKNVIACEKRLAASDSPDLRRDLTRYLLDLRLQQLNSFDDNREKTIEALEEIAKIDAAHLAGRIAAFQKLRATGPDPESRRRENVANDSLDVLGAIAVISSDGTPKLVADSFTKFRDDHVAKAEKKTADDAEAAKRAACKDADDLADDLTTAADVERCFDVLTVAIGRTGDEDLRENLNAVEDAGIALARLQTRDLGKLRKKLETAEDADKPKLTKQIKAAEDDIALLTEIAVIPAARRTCKDNDPRDLRDDATAIVRCVDALNQQIADEAPSRPEEVSEEHPAGGALQVFLARIEDSKVHVDQQAARADLLEREKQGSFWARRKARLDDELSRVKFDLDTQGNIAVPAEARTYCPEEQLDLTSRDMVRRCVNALRAAIDGGGPSYAEKNKGSTTDHRLERQLAFVQDVGGELAARDKDAIARLDDRIANASEADKPKLKAQQQALKDDLQLLGDAGINPGGKYDCDDPNIASKIGRDAAAIQRCVATASRRVEETKNAGVSALTETPEQKHLLDIQRVGRKLAESDEAELASVEAKLKDEKDEGKKKILTARRDELTMEIASLTEKAVVPAVKHDDCEKKDAHLFIKEDAVFVRRCIDVLLTDLEKIPTDKEHKRVRTEKSVMLARFEEAGRRVAKLKSDKLTSLRTLHDKETDPGKKADYDVQLDGVNKQISLLREVLIIPNEDPQTEFNDFEQWFTKFSMGYEYAGVNNAFAKGFPRISGIFGLHLPRVEVPDEDQQNLHLKAYGGYLLFNIALTNSSEVPTADVFAAAASSSGNVRALDDSGRTGGSGTPAAAQGEIKRALDFEFQGFYPWWRTDYQRVNRRLRTSIGPAWSFGGLKVDDESFMHHRAYAGILFARGPETFWSAMFGRTGGLRSHRIEARGQYVLPYTFKTGHLALGAVGNFGVNKRRHGNCDVVTNDSCQQGEKDVIRFYLSYNIEGDGFLNFFGRTNATGTGKE